MLKTLRTETPAQVEFKELIEKFLPLAEGAIIGMAAYADAITQARELYSQKSHTHATLITIDTLFIYAAAAAKYAGNSDLAKDAISEALIGGAKVELVSNIANQLEIKAEFKAAMAAHFSSSKRP